MGTETFCVEGLSTVSGCDLSTTSEEMKTNKWQENRRCNMAIKDIDMSLMTHSILVEQEGFQEFYLKSRTVTDDYVIFSSV